MLPELLSRNSLKKKMSMILNDECSYPVVVMVTMAHHMPSRTPLRNDFGKCPEFSL